MSDNSEIREKRILERMTKLMNVKETSDTDTQYLKKISHDDLCKALCYWLDQTKLVFGEAAWIQQTQALNDAGVDVALDLNRSGVKIGFQVKSHGDIKEKDFFKKTMMQITQSKKHNLSCFFIAFAADLTNKKQIHRIGYILSEIHQQNDDSIITVTPGKLLTIVKAFKENIHPFQCVEMDTEGAMILMQGIAESMSNEQRKVIPSIKVEYSNKSSENEGLKLNFGLKAPAENWNLFDKLEKSHITGEPVIIPKEIINKIEISEDNKLIFREIDKISDIVITPTKQKISFNIEPLDENREIIDTLKNYEFIRKYDGTTYRLSASNQDQPLIIGFGVNEQKKTSTFTFNVVFSKGDCLQVLKALDFLKSIKESNTILLTRCENNLSMEGKLDAESIEIEERFYQIILCLTKIQELTGRIITIPEDTRRVYQEEGIIRQALEAIQQGYLLHESVELVVRFHRIKALKLIEKYEKEGTLESCSYRNNNLTVT